LFLQLTIKSIRTDELAGTLLQYFWVDFSFIWKLIWSFWFFFSYLHLLVSSVLKIV